MGSTTRTSWYAAAALLILSGLFLAAAAAVRWYPCLGHLADPVCIARQSRTYEYLAPTQRSNALPATVVLAGLGLLLLAASWPPLVRRLDVRPGLRIALAAIMMVKPLLLGGLVLAAPLLGGLPRGASPVLLGVEIALDLAALGLVLAVPSHLLVDYQRLLVAAVAFWLVGWVGQVLDALIFSLLTSEGESAPGSGLLTAELVVCCGVGVALITAHTRKRESPAPAARDPLEGARHG